MCSGRCGGARLRAPCRARRRAHRPRPRALDPGAQGFGAIAGHGVDARVEGRERLVGGPNLLRRLGVTLPAELEEFSRAAAGRGQSVVFLVEEGRAAAAFAVADAARPESTDSVKRLHAMGLEVAMLTGDSRAVAEAVAREIGIDTVHACSRTGRRRSSKRSGEAACGSPWWATA